MRVSRETHVNVVLNSPLQHAYTKLKLLRPHILPDAAAKARRPIEMMNISQQEVTHTEEQSIPHIDLVAEAFFRH